MKGKISAIYYCNDKNGAGFLHSKHIANELAKIAEAKLITKPRSLKEFLKYRKRIKEADIFHERFCINPMPLLLWFGSDAKYVLEMNDPGFETWSGLKKYLYRPFIKLKLLFCDAIVTQTETLRKIISRHTDKPIFVLPNAANPSLFRIPRKEINKIKDKYRNKKVVCLVSSFQPWHGVIETIKLAVKKEFGNVVFLLIGNGPLYEKAKSLVKEKNLERRVKLLGSMEQKRLAKYIKASDVCIAPFTLNFAPLAKYGFWWNPLKLYEYMAAGKPIVSFNFAEVRKIVGKAALLAKPNDFNDFANKLRMLLSNSNLRRKLHREAEKLSKENTWKKRAKQLLNIYKGLL
ncbi:MAG: glycosyltransferase family 4 protein [Candidatus Diapherotrites archaeon]|nr:glycosyltransferase family 4 protein [Candidatus Diapherotrites archaeon]